MNSTPLTKEFFLQCINKDYSNKILRVHSDVPELKSLFFYFSVDDEIDQVEIIIFKRTLLKIFKECHDVFNNNLKHGWDISDPSELLQTYYATVGLILSTPGNNSAYNTHHQIVTHILNSTRSEDGYIDLLMDPELFAYKELCFIETLLNSGMNRINKSSQLWQMLKRLFIYNFERDHEKIDVLRFVKISMESNKLHSTNYYSWNFLRWIADFCKIKLPNVVKEIFQIVWSFCKKNLGDSAAWFSLFSICSLNKKAIEFMLGECAITIDDDCNCFAIDSLTLPFDKEIKFTEIFQWIKKNEVKTEAPYMALRNFTSYLGSCTVVIEAIRDSKAITLNFEEILKSRKIEIISHRSWFELNSNFDSDFFFAERIKYYFRMRELSLWYDKFGTTYNDATKTKDISTKNLTNFRNQNKTIQN